VTIRRHPVPAHHLDASREPPCEAPPPEAGRVQRAPHPLWSIAFLLVVAQALLWGGARAGQVERGVAYAAALVCLGGALHFLERVEPRHLAAKLGWRRPAAPWLGLAVLAALPAAWTAVPGVRSPAAFVVALVAAAWQESFCRGWALQALMRRHGFAASAAGAALASASFAAVTAHAAAGAPVAALVAVELPLSLGLAQCAWLSQSIVPGAVLRAALVLAAGAGWWPAAAAAALLWAGSTWLAQRRRPAPPA
jgi:hypothetical protein